MPYDARSWLTVEEPEARAVTALSSAELDEELPGLVVAVAGDD